MNLSVTPTERLKLEKALASSLASIKSITSGWSQRKIPMLAPRLLPPWTITPVAWLKILMKETGPEASPLVVETRSPWGLNREKSKPVPPPVW